jgi:tetratricopeptide (TPR) repeat protein
MRSRLLITVAAAAVGFTATAMYLGTREHRRTSARATTMQQQTQTRPATGPARLKPQRDAITVTPELIQAYNQACDLAQADPQAEWEYYEAFIDRYPLSPLTPRMMSRLGMSYSKRNRFDDAANMLRAAKDLLGNDPFADTVDINLAHVYLLQEDVEHARQILRDVTSRTARDDYPVSGVSGTAAFVAPLTLAETYIHERKNKEAEDVLHALTQRMGQLIKSHPDQPWMTSYAGDAYSKSIYLCLRSQPPDRERARKLLQEMKDLMPDYYGPAGYDEAFKRIELGQELQGEKKDLQQKDVRQQPPEGQRREVDPARPPQPQPLPPQLQLQPQPQPQPQQQQQQQQQDVKPKTY